VIEVEWHAFMDGTINDNVDVITDMEGGQVLGNVDRTMLTEWLSKFLAGVVTNTV